MLGRGTETSSPEDVSHTLRLVEELLRDVQLANSLWDVWPRRFIGLYSSNSGRWRSYHKGWFVFWGRMNAPASTQYTYEPGKEATLRTI